MDVTARDTEPHEPVTILLTHEVDESREAEFRQVIADTTEIARAFPGFLGIHIYTKEASGNLIFELLHKFDSLEHFNLWNDSPERAKMVAEIAAVVTVTHRHHVLTGLETWFAITDGPITPPPRYKMAMLTWLGSFPCLLFILLAILNFAPTLPFLLKALVVSLVMVILMTYLVMPLVTKLFYKWLYP
jgi:antibiotic biosynthesis monooxygenase (ABM) superfamily enzyme